MQEVSLETKSKFDKAQKDLKLVQSRLFNSCKKKEALERKINEAEAEKNSLMAIDYLERTKKHAGELKALETKLEGLKRECSDIAAISEKLTEVLESRKAELMRLELEYLTEEQDSCQEQIDEIAKRYRAGHAELLTMKAEATEIKHRLRDFRDRQAKLEKEAHAI